MARRLLIPLLVLVLLLGTASVAAARPGTRFDDERGIELVDGTGRTTIALKGALIGSVGSGWVWVTDLPGGADTDIFVAGDEDSYQVSAQTTAYRGENLRFRVFRGKWRVRIRGVDIDVSAVGNGSVGLAGTRGRYAVAGGPFRAWPEEWKTIKLGP
jgi:hypothetical protein